jgi:hypothetical protein
MLKVNVGMSRKVSKDYNSTGFSVNLDGEICAPLDDAEFVIEKIKELYDLAEEALHQQIDRYEGESAIASRDEPQEEFSRSQQPANNRVAGNGNGHHSSPGHENGQSRNGGHSEPVPATNKQVQYLLTLGKRQGLTKVQLEAQVAQIIGRKIDLYELTKRDAGVVLDQLTEQVGGSSNQR